MSVDGSIKLDTSIDTSGLEKGVINMTRILGSSEKAMKALTKASSEQQKQSEALARGINVAAKALEEQEKAGSLTTGTILKLIDAGYASALAIDEETGAIRLNTDAYLQLAQARIEEQIAAVQQQRRELITAKFAQERQAAEALANGYLDLAMAHKAASATMNGEITDAAATITALQKMKDALGSSITSGGATKKSAASSAGTRKTGKSAEELAEEQYKKAKDTIDYLRKMDLLDENAYYQELGGLRDRYLKENSDLWRSASVDIYQYEKEMREKAAKETEEWLKAQQEAQKELLQASLDELNGLLNEYETALGAITQKQEAMASKLAEYGGLMETAGKGETSQARLIDLQKSIDKITEYGDALQNLKDRGISQDLLTEVTRMSIDDALTYAGLLMQKSDEDFQAYMTLWETQQALAAEQARTFYQSELDALHEEFEGKFADAFASLKETGFQVGVDSMEGLLRGLESREQALLRKARSIAAAVEAALRGPQGFDTHSPSKKTLDIGEMVGQGLVEGMQKKLHDVESAAMALTSLPMLTQPVIGSAGTDDGATQTANALLTGLQTALQPVKQALQTPQEVVLTVDGVELGRAALPGVRKEAERTGIKWG